jgi:hypothetical protein
VGAGCDFGSAAACCAGSFAGVAASGAFFENVLGIRPVNTPTPTAQKMMTAIAAMMMIGLVRLCISDMIVLQFFPE